MGEAQDDRALPRLGRDPAAPTHELSAVHESQPLRTPDLHAESPPGLPHRVPSGEVGLIEISRRSHSLLSEREPLEQRDLLETLLSNSFLTGKVLTVEWREPFGILASRPDDDPDEKDPGLGGPGQLSKWSAFLDAYRTFWVEADEDAVGEMRRLKVLIGR